MLQLNLNVSLNRFQDLVKFEQFEDATIFKCTADKLITFDKQFKEKRSGSLDVPGTYVLYFI